MLLLILMLGSPFLDFFEEECKEWRVDFSSMLSYD